MASRRFKTKAAAVKFWNNLSDYSARGSSLKRKRGGYEVHAPNLSFKAKPPGKGWKKWK